MIVEGPTAVSDSPLQSRYDSRRVVNQGVNFENYRAREAEKGSPLRAAGWIPRGSKPRFATRERAYMGDNNYGHLKVEMTRARGRRTASRRNNPGNGRIANPVSRSLPLKLPYQKSPGLSNSLLPSSSPRRWCWAVAASSRQLAPPYLSMTFRREISRGYDSTQEYNFHVNVRARAFTLPYNPRENAIRFA